MKYIHRVLLVSALWLGLANGEHWSVTGGSGDCEGKAFITSVPYFQGHLELAVSLYLRSHLL